jgi:hypothetical protein
MSGSTKEAFTSATKPTKPVIGGLYEHCTDNWTAWTGEPNHTWDGLDPSAREKYKNPNQLRYQDPSYESKGFNRRVIPLDTKFEKGDDLRTFKLDITKHLVKHGMDTITYLNDPENSANMTSSVIEDHARFTADTAREKSEFCVMLFDKYDDSNNEAAVEYLLGSLGPLLLQSVRDDLETADPFTVVWLLIIKNIQSTLIDTYQDMNNKIRALKPAHYEVRTSNFLPVISSVSPNSSFRLDTMSTRSLLWCLSRFLLVEVEETKPTHFRF